jgi:hypothetical protein
VYGGGEVPLRLKWPGLQADYIDIVTIKDIKGVRPFPEHPQDAVLSATQKNSTIDLKLLGQKLKQEKPNACSLLFIKTEDTVVCFIQRPS